MSCLPARAAASPDPRGFHIVSAATLAVEPLVRGADLDPGTHLDLVGAFRRDMREADAEAIRRARLVVDTRAGALAEAGGDTSPARADEPYRRAVTGLYARLAATYARVVGHAPPRAAAAAPAAPRAAWRARAARTRRSRRRRGRRAS